MSHPGKISWIPLASAATLMASPMLPAQDWQTVDDFALGAGNAEAHGVATDAAGGIYVVGTANGHGIVRYSADDGSNWITRDDFVYPATNNGLNAVMVDDQGSVFVGGSSAGHWNVRRSTDRGATWETVDDYFRPFIPPDQPGISGAVTSLGSDGQGRVYGAGPMRLFGCPCYNTWWIRGSSIGGTNWSDKLVMGSGYGGIGQAACAGTDVYVTGTADSDRGDGDLRLILRSSDHGATWSTVFQATNDVHTAITADPGGNLYFAGASWGSNSIVWLVRRAAPGGTNWTPLDGSSYAEVPPVTEGQPYGASIAVGSVAVDAAGNVAVTGAFLVYWVISHPPYTTYGADQTWVTGQYSAATGQWRTTDQFSYSTNRQGSARGIAIAPSGSEFAVGFGTSDSGQRRWVVRKQAAPSPLALATALEAEVNHVIARSAIAGGRARMLLALVDRIVAGIEQGEPAFVCKRAGTFSKKVQEFVEQGTLSQSDGQLLMNGTENLRLTLGCRSN
jgi:hypothetical protein